MDADYVVVGTGSAGSVVANRLSADPKVRVTVLEAGPKDNDNSFTSPRFRELFRTEHDWDYLTEPQNQLDGRQIYWPRGRTLGGSSSMNAMMWVRGFAADYDEWGEIVDEQWSFAKVAPYFDRIEAGPLVISPQQPPRLHRRLAHRCPGVRLPAGASECRCTGRLFPDAGNPTPGRAMELCRRVSETRTAAANLTLLTEARARRVLFDGSRLSVSSSKGRQAPRGACGSRSGAQRRCREQPATVDGVGHRGRLGAHRAWHRRRASRAAVGKNLIDHLAVPLGFDVRHDSLFAAEKPWKLVKYLLRRRGMLTSNVAEAYGFVRSNPDLELPDLELIFAAAPFFDEGLGDPYGHAVVTGPILVKPHSRGSISLSSSDPTAKPVIDPQYLSDPDGNDHAALMSGLRITARIAQTRALKDVLGKVARPLGAHDTGEETLEAALRTCAHTLYHPVGTCWMGSDPSSVVDPVLRVRGVDRLRVADASVMSIIRDTRTHPAC